ncbi:MAG TPA: MmcQ/YjbR family DNA-binding protein [Candidatus Dormibacteraeota bacterium]|nr:MmcQ/YjbR family DNA-binding protein [Candidatus Dormibacteraeota bacterium]
MATPDDVRRIALSLPETSEAEGRFAFSVLSRGKQKGFAWVWAERVHPKKARVPNPAVLAVRVGDEIEKDILLRSDEDKFFTEPHYKGFPAVLVRLAAIDAGELEELITNAWRDQAPRELREAFDSTSLG